MKIRLNGKQIEIHADAVTDVLAHLGIATGHRGVAVAVNGSVVPRSTWSTAPVEPGDEVEVIGAAQGG